MRQVLQNVRFYYKMRLIANAAFITNASLQYQIESLMFEKQLIFTMVFSNKEGRSGTSGNRI